MITDNYFDNQYDPSVLFLFFCLVLFCLSLTFELAACAICCRVAVVNTIKFFRLATQLQFTRMVFFSESVAIIFNILHVIKSPVSAGPAEM